MNLSRRILPLLFPCFVIAGPAWSQTVLGPGDVAFLGIQSGQSGQTALDRFAFVLIKPVEEGTRILFTDNAVLSASSPLKFCRNEGFCTWTATGSFPAGTVVTYTEDSTVSVGLGSGGLSLSQSGDQILALQIQGSDTVALAGVSTTGWAQNCASVCGGASNNATCLPNGLVAAQQAVGFASELNNAYFLAPSLSGSQQELLTALNDPNNWAQSNELQTWPAWAFQVTRVHAFASPGSIKITGLPWGWAFSNLPEGSRSIALYSLDGRQIDRVEVQNMQEVEVADRSTGRVLLFRLETDRGMISGRIAGK